MRIEGRSWNGRGGPHTYVAAGTHEARLFVYQAPWLVDGGLASVQVDIEVH